MSQAPLPMSQASLPMSQASPMAGAEPCASVSPAALAPQTLNRCCVAASNLSCVRGGVTVLKNINLQVEPGQCIALLGKNGAGKTTLLESLLGFSLPSFGQAQLWGGPTKAIGAEQKQRIGFVPQIDELLPGMTGAEHLQLHRSFRQHWNSELVERLVRDWMVPLDSAVGKLSVGQRQKLAILLAMAHEPELLVLDEPVASLDPIARRQFLQQLVEIASDERRAVIFSTHIVSDVERIANQVWMLRDGEMLYQGELDQLKETTVRIRLRPQPELLALFNGHKVIRQQLDKYQYQLCLGDWNPTLAKQLQAQLPDPLVVEPLSLEDIFLEMNA